MWTPFLLYDWLVPAITLWTIVVQLQGTLAAEPPVEAELTPYIGSPVRTSGGLVIRELLEIGKRQSCGAGYGVCRTSGRCCPLNGSCCTTGGCCGSGDWCYSTGCCSRSDMGCAQVSCCPLGSNCCRDGGCCESNQYCVISPSGKGGCCPNGRICSGEPPPTKIISPPAPTTTQAPPPPAPTTTKAPPPPPVTTTGNPSPSPSPAAGSPTTIQAFSPTSTGLPLFSNTPLSNSTQRPASTETTSFQTSAPAGLLSSAYRNLELLQGSLILLSLLGVFAPFIIL